MSTSLIKWIGILLLAVGFIPSQGQNDLLDMLDAEIKPVRTPVDATFKSTRVINCHSIERMQGGDLELHVSHRFGLINSGFKKFFGLDESSSHVSLEYGITDWMEVGLGRATVDEQFNGFVKFSPIRQSKGKWAMPVSASLYLAAITTTKDYPDPTWVVDAAHRRSFVAQVLVARKFAPWLSLQVSPTFIHRNMVATPMDPNRLFALGVGGRVKFTRRAALSFEYFWLKDRSLLTGPPRYNPLSIGIDIETGSHVFQIFVSNSFQILENGFIGDTYGSWKKSGLHVGFNVSRVFTVIRKKV
jgi:hypothetical protein